jgi:hypothetical protein
VSRLRATDRFSSSACLRASYGANTDSFLWPFQPCYEENQCSTEIKLPIVEPPALYTEPLRSSEFRSVLKTKDWPHQLT